MLCKHLLKLWAIKSFHKQKKCCTAFFFFLWFFFFNKTKTRQMPVSLWTQLVNKRTTWRRRAKMQLKRLQPLQLPTHPKVATIFLTLLTDSSFLKWINEWINGNWQRNKSSQSSSTMQALVSVLLTLLLVPSSNQTVLLLNWMRESYNFILE